MTDKLVDKVIGLEAKSAEIALEESGYIVRVSDNAPCDCQYREDRVTLTVKNGLVVKVEVG